MKLVFATNNMHKLAEVSEILGKQITLLGLRDIGFFEDIPETASTLEGNAILKARCINGSTACDCFADDTGLEVEALDNAPGVLSARYAGEQHNDALNMEKLLLSMKGITNRKARFRTVIALIVGGKEYLFEGSLDGHITEEKRGSAGFGYDPLFIPDGFSETFAELGLEIKNVISHRAIATKKLASFLSTFNEP